MQVGLELPSHSDLLPGVEHLVEGAEDDGAAPRLHKVGVWSTRVDEGIGEEGHEHLVVLLVDGVVQRSLPPLVSHVEVDDLSGVLLVETGAVEEGLVLPLSYSDVDWRGLQGVDVVQAHASELHALLEDFEGQLWVLLVLHEDKMNDVGTD